MMLEACRLVRARLGEERSIGLLYAWQDIGGWDPHRMTALL
jgi:hypothetical protein